jgi:hypothetical protein
MGGEQGAEPECASEHRGEGQTGQTAGALDRGGGRDDTRGSVWAGQALSAKTATDFMVGLTQQKYNGI